MSFFLLQTQQCENIFTMSCSPSRVTELSTHLLSIKQITNWTPSCSSHTSFFKHCGRLSRDLWHEQFSLSWIQFKQSTEDKTQSVSSSSFCLPQVSQLFSRWIGCLLTSGTKVIELSQQNLVSSTTNWLTMNEHLTLMNWSQTCYRILCGDSSALPKPEVSVFWDDVLKLLHQHRGINTIINNPS